LRCGVCAQRSRELGRAHGVWEVDEFICELAYLRGSETCPVTSFEGAIGVLLYGIFALEQVCGEGRVVGDGASCRVATLWLQYRHSNSDRTTRRVACMYRFIAGIVGCRA
jgi:hypothetical protein